MAKSRPNGKNDKILKQLRDYGLALPGAHLKSPWPGHKDLAVNDKTFAYLSIEGEPLSISCKLPRSSHLALMLPHAQPTPYGLGKSGWVSMQFPDGKVPVDMLKQWIDESYRAQAPKKLLEQLTEGKTPPAVTKAKSSAGKPAAKQAARPAANAAKKSAAKKKAAKSNKR
jgi:predicted DNA-binding protein (MmcQ/YjbR family)